MFTTYEWFKRLSIIIGQSGRLSGINAKEKGAIERKHPFSATNLFYGQAEGGLSDKDKHCFISSQTILLNYYRILMDFNGFWRCLEALGGV